MQNKFKICIWFIIVSVFKSNGVLKFIMVAVIGIIIGASLLQASLAEVQEKLAPSSALDIVVKPKPEKPAKTWDLMVIGSDERTFGSDAEGGSRSDSVWMVRLDGQGKTVSVWSLPRDWLVSIPGKNTTDKLTNSYGLGGTKLLLKTVEKHTNVKVDGVVMLRFEAFSRLVNRFGCLYTDIDRRYYNKNTGTLATNYSEIDLKPGYQKLCGLDSLAFARHRHSDNDLVRSKRQLSILKSAQRQWTGRTFLSSPTAMLDLLPYVNTTVNKKKDLLDLAETVFALKDSKIKNIKWAGHIQGANVVASKAEVKKMRDQWYGKETLNFKPQKNLVTPKKSSVRFSTKNWQSLTFDKHSIKVPLAANNVQQRKYYINTPGGNKKAWRLVIGGWQGQAAGIQWTAWNNPPILKDSSLVYKKACGGWFWISNTLPNNLNKNEQKALLRQTSCSWIK